MKTLTNLTGKRSCLGAILSALLLVCLVAFGSTATLAQDARLQLSHLDKLASKASEVTNVNLEGPMLKLAADQMSQSDLESVLNQLDKVHTAKSPEKTAKAFAAANMLRRLKGIYVKVFEFSKPGEYSKSDLESVLNQLDSGGWKAIVHVEQKKSGQTTGVYVMEEGGETVGMAIVAAEPKELTVVNLVGPIDFSQFSGLGSLGALGQLGGLGGSIGNSKPQLQHRDQSDQKPNQRGDSK
jgi:Domain of unknown function (DUF4252)